MLGISELQLTRLRELIKTGSEAKFYNWQAWRRVRREVRKLDNFECQRCKARGKYSRGTIVHHVKHLNERPDLALSIYDEASGERQLITVCKACHEAEHPESLAEFLPKAPPLTSERWD